MLPLSSVEAMLVLIQAHVNGPALLEPKAPGPYTVP